MKFTLSYLKKQLLERTKEELVQEISNLCQKFPQVREYYQAQTDDTGVIVKKYTDIIEKEFVEGKTRGMPKARLSVAMKALKDFRKIIQNPALVAEVMFTYVESVSSFSSQFEPRDEDYYTDPEEVFEELLELLKRNNLEQKFKDRAHDIVADATDSYGYQESLQERYEDIYGEFKE